MSQGGGTPRSPTFHSPKTDTKPGWSSLASSKPTRPFAAWPRSSAPRLGGEPATTREAWKGTRDKARLGFPLHPESPSPAPLRLNALYRRPGTKARKSDPVFPRRHPWLSPARPAGATGAFAPQNERRRTAPGARRARVSGSTRRAHGAARGAFRCRRQESRRAGWEVPGWRDSPLLTRTLPEPEAHKDSTALALPHTGPKLD